MILIELTAASDMRWANSLWGAVLFRMGRDLLIIIRTVSWREASQRAWNIGGDEARNGPPLAEAWVTGIFAGLQTLPILGLRRLDLQRAHGARRHFLLSEWEPGRVGTLHTALTNAFAQLQ